MPRKPYYIHPAAIVDTKHIGASTRIWAFVHILKGARIGKNCNICDHCFIEDDVVIGDNVTIKSGVYVWDGAVIEDNCFIGPNATFTNDIYPRSKMYQREPARILIKKGASVGAHSVLRAGITIGEWAMIGAGAVVTKDIKPYAVVYGNPAQQHGFICACKQKLKVRTKKTTLCLCGARYRYTKEMLVKV